MPAPVPVPVTSPAPDVDQYFNDMDLDIERLDDDDGEGDDDREGDDELEMVDESEIFTGEGEDSDPPFLTSPKTRVVHSNSLHHILMVNCQCQGDEAVLLDFFAAQLLPASFKRIKTLFTVQVLDMFWLCNLKLKASTYQFYQLLHRLTQPMSTADVDNLYREFRRMTRIWRLMKKFKWAGYAGGTKSIKEVKPGVLTIFCLAWVSISRITGRMTVHGMLLHSFICIISENW